MKEIICGIYKITSPSNRIYIGQSISIYERWKKYNNPNSIKSQIKLYNSLKKYGTNNHKFEILFECDNFLLNFFEIYFVDLYNSYKEGLNCNEGGFGQSGIKHSEEAKIKMSVSHKGLQAGEKHGMFGKTHSKEAREKISKANMGHVCYTLGIKQSDESNKKNSASGKLAWAKRKNDPDYNSDENIKRRSTPKSDSTKENMKSIWAEKKKTPEFNSEEAFAKRALISRIANASQTQNSPTLSLIDPIVVCNLYNDGLTLTAIALKYSVSRQPIRRILVENNIVISNKRNGSVK